VLAHTKTEVRKDENTITKADARRPNSMNIPILLTATVNPHGMKGANFDPEERLNMYVEALEFYVKKGLKVVFAENSGSLNLVSSFRFQVSSIDNVEFVDVSGDEYDQSRGKGYNETILIHKAIQKSRFIQDAGCFFKLTGRLKLLNVAALLGECANESEARKRSTKADARRLTHEGAEPTKTSLQSMRFLADCKDHKVYEWLHMPINGHVGECRYWFASVESFESMMWPRYKELNDYPPNICLAEDLMLDVCRKSRGMEGCKDRFRTQARISGKGGHNLGKGWSFFYSTDNDSMALKVKCYLRQMLRWCMPWWRV